MARSSWANKDQVKLLIAQDEAESVIKSDEPEPMSDEEHAEFNALMRPGATDAELETVMRDDFRWSYIARDPLGKVCAWGRGEREECIREFFKSADEHAACELVVDCGDDSELKHLAGDRTVGARLVAAAFR